MEFGRVRKEGASLVVNLPPKVTRLLGLQPQDRMAMRVIGSLLVMERVPMEQLAKLTQAPVPIYGGGGR